MSVEERTTDALMLQDLKELYEEAYYVNELSERSLNKFHEISEKLSKALPKLTDSNSLFEIDDLLYQENELSYSTPSNVPLEESNEILNNDCFEGFLVVYLELREWKSLPKYYRLATTFLEIIEKAPDIMKLIYWRITPFVAMLMSSRNTNKVCFALKVLNIILKHKYIIESDTRSSSFSHLYMWMKRLLHIPQARHPRQQRIHSWLFRQATAIFGMLEQESYEATSIRKYLGDYGTHSEFDVIYVQSLRGGGMYYASSILSDHLHTFFMSAKNEDERTNRLTNFLLAISREHGEDEVYDQLNLQFMPMFYRIFGDLLEEPDKQTMFADDILRGMEKKYGLEIKPYLPLSNIKHQNDVEDSKVDLNDELINKSINSEDETDDTIEKFLFYDDFVKQLQVLDAIHTAFTMNQEMKIVYDIGYETKVFRKYSSPIRIYLEKTFLNPQKRGYVPWVIELLLRKCPYMILPKRHEYLKEDLIKMLKGEEIDEFVEEDLYYLINCLRDDKPDYDIVYIDSDNEND